MVARRPGMRDARARMFSLRCGGTADNERSVDVHRPFALRWPSGDGSRQPIRAALAGLVIAPLASSQTMIAPIGAIIGSLPALTFTHVISGTIVVVLMAPRSPQLSAQ